jgi:BlaI family transcriptional regulator, penicillinase repressor
MVTMKPIQDVTDAELSVLQVLWDEGPCSLRRIAESLYPKKPLVAAQATVLKLLERLEGKKCVRRERGDGPQQFLAVVNRDELIGRRLRAMADQLCEGSLSPLLTNLVKAGSLSSKERNELQNLLAELTANPSRRS